MADVAKFLCFLLLLCRCATAAPAPGAAPAAANDDTISYHRAVRPVLQSHCYGCHQPAKRQGALDMTSLEAMRQGGERGEPVLVAGKPDGSLLLEMITLVDGEAEMPKHKPPLTAEQIAMIRRWVAQGALDDSPAAAAAIYTAQRPPTYRLRPVLTALDYAPDGSLLAVSGYHEVLLHAADGSRLVARLVGLSERIESLKFSPDGSRLAVTGGSPGRMGEVQVWDVARRRLLRSVNVTYDTVYGASWSPDASLVAFGCGDATLRAIDVASGAEVFYQSAHTDWVMDSVFSIDGSHLISVSRDRSMKLNVVATQRFVDNITSITPGALKGGLHAVDRHPERDELLAGGADGVPRIYRMLRKKARKIGDDYNLIRELPAMPGRVFDVRYSPDGHFVVAGSSDHGKGAVWVSRENNGELVARMQDIRGGIYGVAFSPDGQTVASGGFDGQVFLNEPATGKLIRKFTPVPLTGDAEIAPH